MAMPVSGLAARGAIATNPSQYAKLDLRPAVMLRNRQRPRPTSLQRLG
ncbi:MAG: hypothetical protein HC838_07215 [Spirulinaceae cyanobacterium RM2_2_10]|nr:hypothetical protein [Spirulinaceae cyanobacterium SM2_1_0]NJO19888.1 hypothetical protein [Spirulinaceae cyanobacterium RM2_2_10]